MKDLIVVCDLEATCWADGKTQLIDDMEVIEIGCVLCDMGGNIKDEFTTFVRPVENPILSPFCTQLTSITQEDVDNAPLFGDAMLLLDNWATKHKSIWGSWGNFDQKLLLSQQQRTGYESLFISLRHFNLKKAWRRTTKRRRQTDLQSALRFHELEFEGTPHRAITDARNTTRLLPHIEPSEIELLISEP